MRENLVEIVARAIARQVSLKRWDDMPEYGPADVSRLDCTSAALAALRAIEGAGMKVVGREATEAMIAASSEALTNWRKTLTRDEAMTRMYIAPDRKFKASATPEEKHAIRFAAMFDAAPAFGGGE